MVKNKKKNTISFISFGIVLFVLCLLSLRFGSADIPMSDFLKALSDVDCKTAYGIIIYSIRFPRVFAGVIAGMGLGISGAVLQTVTGNKMASPNLVGVNSGAGFAVILSLSLFPSLFAYVPLFALAGAFLSTLFIIAISKKVGMTNTSVILVGLAFSSILSAGISLMSLLDSDVLVSYNSFSIGSLSAVSLDDLYIPLVMVAAALVICLILSEKLDILTLGDTAAKSLGINVTAVRITALLIASACAAAAVSFAGLLGFVGLMSPHIARCFFRSKTKYTVVASAITGAILVTAADLAGRVLFAPSELPAGIFMALVGAPFFLCLLIAGRRKCND